MIAAVLSLAAAIARAQAAVTCPDPNATVQDCPSDYLTKLKAPPATAVRIKIADEIKTALQLRDDYLQALAAYEGSEKSGASKDEVLAKGEAAEALRRKMYAGFNKALKHTVDEYNLTPPKASFERDARLPREVRNAGREWRPRFSEQETRKVDDSHVWRMRTDDQLAQEAAENEFVDPSGQRVRGGVIASGTWQADNRISMYWLSFVTEKKDASGRTVLDSHNQPVYEPNPDALAALVVHETVHWVENVSKRTGYVDTASGYFTEEALAYRRQAAALLNSNPHADPSGALAMAAKYDEQARLSQGMTREQVVSKYSGKFLGLKALIQRDRTMARTTPEPPSEAAASQDFKANLEKIRQDAAALRKSHDAATAAAATDGIQRIADDACRGRWPTREALNRLIREIRFSIQADPYGPVSGSTCGERVFKALMWQAFLPNFTSMEVSWLVDQVRFAQMGPPAVVDQLVRARRISAEACNGKIAAQAELDDLREGLLGYLPSHPYNPSADSACDNAILLAIVDKAFWSNSIGEDWLRARVAQAKADAVAPHNWLEAQQSLGALAQAACDGKTLDQDTLDRAMGYVTKYPQSMGWAANDVSCYRVIMGRMSELALSGNSIWADWVAWKVDHLDTETRPIPAPAQGGSSNSGSSGYQGSSSHDFSHAHDIANRIPNIRF